MGQGGAAGPWLSLWLWAPGQVDSYGGGDPPICPQSCPETGGEVSPQLLGPGLPSGGQAAGRAECPEVWTCIPGQLLHRDLQGLVGLVSVFVFHVALHEEVRCPRTSSCFE